MVVEGFPLPLPKDKGLALVVGGGAAMAAQGSLSSMLFLADVLEAVFGGGAEIEPQRSSSLLEVDEGFDFIDFVVVLEAGAGMAPQRSSSPDFAVARFDFGREGFVSGKKMYKFW